MTEWVTAVRQELGLEDTVDADALVDKVLDLTADVAHGVSRPAAPVTAYLLGLAAGRADDLTVATNDFAGVISRLAEGWAADVDVLLAERAAARDDLRRAQPHHELAGDAVATAVLLRAVGAHVAGTERGRGANQLPGVLAGLGYTLDLHERVRRLRDVDDQGDPGVPRQRPPLRRRGAGVEHDLAVLDDEPHRRREGAAVGGGEGEDSGAGAGGEEVDDLGGQLGAHAPRNPAGAG